MTVSPYLTQPLRTEVEARRAQLATDLRAEGNSEQTVERLATDEIAGRLVEHERHIVGAITAMFGGAK